MKLILSRKGFDSSAGGVPSAILANGQLLEIHHPKIYDSYINRIMVIQWES
ncbi:hypothetical protein [Franzmannia qiaohouensis]|uniref:Nucleotide modification associated domain-containing protein n=1 Tax=Franzmannia qiaohouensis TaxID=1329370 RepID=A0ABU1HE48_9GAMM|nr:hypothetical protein [Halomonas qiaohouensis]MDR5905606.1 hypothetical protein [Halomonas qiaohouensis]